MCLKSELLSYILARLQQTVKVERQYRKLYQGNLKLLDRGHSHSTGHRKRRPSSVRDKCPGRYTLVSSLPSHAPVGKMRAEPKAPKHSREGCETSATRGVRPRGCWQVWGPHVGRLIYIGEGDLPAASSSPEGAPCIHSRVLSVI